MSSLNAILERWTGLILLDPLWFGVSVFLLSGTVLFARRIGARSAGFPGLSFLFGKGFDPAQRSVREVARPRTIGRRAAIARRLPIVSYVALGAFSIALGRPVERVRIPRSEEGIDILLVIDVSSSMLAKDLDPQRTRLEVAKSAAEKFVDGRKNDRIGLVVFARYPDLAVPLTLDHAALVRLFGEIETVDNEGPEDATGIGTALAFGAETLRKTKSRSKVVVLLSDGEENIAGPETPAEIAPIHAAQLCLDLGIRVYGIAAGHGAPGRDGKFVPVDTRQMERMAQKTGGKFFSAKDAAALDRVYADISALEKSAVDEPRFKYIDRFFGFLVFGIALFLGRFWLERSYLEVLP